MAAHDLYLRGLFHWNRRSPADLTHALDFFEQAAALDPDYALPHAGLALVYAVLPISFIGPAAAGAFERAEAAARRALALDPSLGEARAALAYAFHCQWRWADAEREFQAAVALSPSSATVHQWYGEHLGKMGSTDAGEAMIRRAIELDPLSLVAHNDLGILLMNSRRYDEAIDQLERTYAMDSGFSLPLLLLHRVRLIVGDAAESERIARRWAELSGARDAEEIGAVVRATARPAERPAALRILERWRDVPSPRWVDLAFFYRYLGENDLAIDALHNGLEARDPMMASLGVTPWADPLRGDPRFQVIMARLGFP